MASREEKVFWNLPSTISSCFLDSRHLLEKDGHFTSDLVDRLSPSRPLSTVILTSSAGSISVYRSQEGPSLVAPSILVHRSDLIGCHICQRRVVTIFGRVEL